MKKIILLGFLVLASACSTSPTEPSAGPEPGWVHEPTRIVDNGYIVYVGSGEDTSRDRAQFKAESAALQDLANECSFVPKGARLEDRFDKTEGRLHEAYAKVGVEFQLCEEAKKALQPEQVKKLANESMTDQIHRYQEMLGDSSDAETIADLDDTEAIPGLKDDPAKQASLPGPANDQFRFFVVRQQVALYKERVILAPAPVYQAATPASDRYLAAVTAASNRVETYRAAHPEVKESNQAWSTHQQHARELVRRRDPRYRNSLPKDAQSPQGHSGKEQKKSGGRGRGGRHHRGATS